MNPFLRLWLLLLGLGALPAGAALAQNTPAAAPPPAATGSITGTVADSAARTPVGYATVALLPASGADKPLTGVAADDAGRFTLEKVAAGSYRLRLSFVGYATRTLPVTVADGPVRLGTVPLPAAATALTEAVVIGEKPVVEVRPDRLVYNAEQDVTNAGGTAADVLRKAPLLSVDADGVPKLRGSGNYKVLINNKPAPALARNIGEALKGIPGDQIKSIEIITTPPAKYDGEGTAGIINIVLKKGVNQKLNGSVSGSAGNRNSSFNSSLNFKQGKVGFNSSLGTGGWYGPQAFSRTRTDYSADGTGYLENRGSGNYGGNWVYGTVGVDFDPAEHHSFSLAGSYNYYKGDSDQDLFNQYRAANPANDLLFARQNTSLFSGTNADVTGTYTRTFARERREWSVLAQYSINPSTFGYEFEQYDGRGTAGPLAEATYRERSYGRAPGHETTVQTDFTQPFGDKQTLEVGLKAIFRRTGSLADVEGAAGGSGEFLTLPARRTDFDYGQDVQAAYAIYSFGLGKKLKMSVGTRAERTAIAADFRTTASGFGRSYVSVLPNGNAQYAFNDKTSLRLAYSRRITRPYIDFLNPFVDRSTPNELRYGNPDLNAELTDSYELSYNTLIKEATLNISASARRTDNAIEQVRLPTDSTSVTAQTFANVAANAYYQLNFYGSVKPLPKWEISGGPDVQYITRRSAALGVRRQGFTAGLNFNTSYKLPKNLTVQAFVYSSLPMPDIQGRGPANLYYGFGAKKTFLKDKADLSLNVANPFNDYWAYVNLLDTPFFNERNEYRAYQRAARLSFSYRFGQEKQGRQRKQIRNDDVKGGGGQQGR